MAANLIELGFVADAVDITRETFQCAEVRRFLAIDLNTDFAEQLSGSYNLITAVEVVEHLRDPWHLMEQCGRLLTEDGAIIITTPNIESALSRVKFLVKGEFLYFSEAEYIASGHISPLTVAQIRRAAEAAGLAMICHTFNRLTKRFPRTPFFLAAGLVAALVRVLAKGHTRGEIHIIGFRKKTSPSHCTTGAS